MPSIAEKQREQQGIQSWFEDIDLLSIEMTSGSLNAFGQLMDKLVGEEQDGRPAEYEVEDLRGKVGVETLAALFIVGKFCKDLRDNFGLGNVGFPEKGAPLVEEISRNLGVFIQVLCFGSNPEESPLRIFGRAIERYGKLISVTNEAAETQTGFAGWHHL